MAEVKNPISDRVKKMAAILEAAQKVGKELKEAKEKGAEAAKGAPARPAELPPS